MTVLSKALLIRGRFAEMGTAVSLGCVSLLSCLPLCLLGAFCVAPVLVRPLVWCVSFEKVIFLYLGCFVFICSSRAFGWSLFPSWSVWSSLHLLPRHTSPVLLLDYFSFRNYSSLFLNVSFVLVFVTLHFLWCVSHVSHLPQSSCYFIV